MMLLPVVLFEAMLSCNAAKAFWAEVLSPELMALVRFSMAVLNASLVVPPAASPSF